MIEGLESADGWFYVDVKESTYTPSYEIDSGYRVELSCDDPVYSYCWNRGSATIEVFGLSGYPVE